MAPTPSRARTPTPPEDIQSQKFKLSGPFSCLHWETTREQWREIRRSQNFRWPWLFLWSFWEFPRKTPGKSREDIGKHLLESRDMLYILGLRAPEKANLLRTLGRHCPEPCPDLLHRIINIYKNRQLQPSRVFLGDRFLSSAGAGGNCALPARVPNCSPVLDKILALIGPEILSSAGRGVWRKAPVAFPDSSSVLDKFLSAIF